MYTGAGKDRDPQQINRWFQAVANFINSYSIKKTDANVCQYNKAYYSNSAVK
jgi:hypothetical protein